MYLISVFVGLAAILITLYVGALNSWMNRAIPPAYCPPSFKHDLDPENKAHKAEVLEDFLLDDRNA